ncbi:MAG TPA: oxygenase MpaB family protein [Kofleriaceae bacterium]|nr:oxygenase MpaB family protein [Kofleriaceae bacterium]
MPVVTREQLEASLASLAKDVRNPAEGILGPQSVAWKLGGDLAVFLGGGRAALLQLAHPMVAYAVDQHSKTRSDVVGRFQRTFRNVFAMVFGDLDDAFTAARRVHSVHTRIHGEIPHAVGAYRAHTPYHANDPDALRWVYATLVDTTIAVRERLDGALPSALKDAYIIEMNRFAALFGIPRDLLAHDWTAHEMYMRRMLSSDEIAVAPVAREMAMFLVGRGGIAPQPPLGRIAEALTSSLLPTRLVHGFGLRTSSLSAAALRIALSTTAPFYRRLPSSAVAIPARSLAASRLVGQPPSRLVAWTERQLFGLTRQVTGS